ncbi:GntP family permease [Nocardioides yefusunii]|uniref:GntP family permease n=1 Tax=Nocardioides yefusunii TaxID=2500546 RepID=A0ABW1QRH6_9ACTN|nr:gluconate:H+ symporter [Nocardioides yefusunii]
MEPLTDASNTQLLIAALLGIATVVVLIVWAKFHPFLALVLGAAVMGGSAGVAPGDIVTSFTSGFGGTVGSVGLLIALGAMVGKILADSGGSNAIVDTIINKVGRKGLPWAMALVAAILGLPLFFEVGVVLLVPVVILVAKTTNLPVMRVGIPALAGLSVLHGLVPPHPGPLVAIGNLDADLGMTLLLGLAVAIPTLIICGPLLAVLIERWVPTQVNEVALARLGATGGSTTDTKGEASFSAPVAAGVVRRPSFGAAVFCILLPVIMMLVRAIAEITIDDKESTLLKTLVFIGEPAVALLAAVLVSMFFLGFRTGMNRTQVESSLGSALPGIASILLIVAAGGGFKQMLVNAGVGNVIGDWAEGAGISTILLGWLVAVGVRLATGSATVATITASGIVAGVATDLDSPELALLVLAIGCGSVFFSHVNDAGFWLVKEYFGLTIGQTLKSWSLMETAISVVGLVIILLLNLVV